MINKDDGKYSQLRCPKLESSSILSIAIQRLLATHFARMFNAINIFRYSFVHANSDCLRKS